MENINSGTEIEDPNTETEDPNTETEDTNTETEDTGTETEDTGTETEDPNTETEGSGTETLHTERIEELIKYWETEEHYAFQGWDFSHIGSRWIEPDLPWDYTAVVASYLKDTDILLDMGTGGGEVLLSIGHPYKNTYATESYVPNFELCMKTLSPLGITVRQTFTDEARLDKLPFDDNLFDVIINRHESFDLSEVDRVIKRGGYFITQQVGSRNTQEFQQRLNDGFMYDRSFHSMQKYVDTLSDLGFEIIKADESTHQIKVYDTGALVFMAKIIVWEYPDFSVKTHVDKLLDCQREIEEKGFLEATGHSFLIVARKI